MGLLEAQKHINENRAKTPNLDDTFKDIQLSLARIERKESSTPMSKNYATAIAQNNLKTPESPAVPLLQTDSKPKQIKVLTPKEERRAKKITVHIGNAADKEKVKMLSIKDLVEALQAEIKGIQRVSQLISSNIKIHAELVKAKKALEKKTE